MSKQNEKKTDPAVKATPKKSNVEIAASKSVAAKSSTAGAQKKPTTKSKKHIADEIKILPSKRVWPD